MLKAKLKAADADKARAEKALAAAKHETSDREKELAAAKRAAADRESKLKAAFAETAGAEKALHAAEHDAERALAAAKHDAEKALADAADREHRLKAKLDASRKTPRASTVARPVAVSGSPLIDLRVLEPRGECADDSAHLSVVGADGTARRHVTCQFPVLACNSCARLPRVTRREALELILVAALGALVSHAAYGALGAFLAARRVLPPPPLVVAGAAGGRGTLLTRAARFVLGLVVGYVLPHGKGGVALLGEKLQFTLI